MNIPETAFCIEGNINDFRIDRKNFDLYKNQKRLKFIDFAYDYFVKINSKDSGTALIFAKKPTMRF